MNFQDSIAFSGGGVKTSVFPASFLTSFLSVFLIGCSNQVHPPSVEQVTEFDNAHPARLTVAMEYVGKAKMSRGLSRVGGESNTANE